VTQSAKSISKTPAVKSVSKAPASKGAEQVAQAAREGWLEEALRKTPSISAAALPLGYAGVQMARGKKISKGQAGILGGTAVALPVIVSRLRKGKGLAGTALLSVPSYMLGSMLAKDLQKRWYEK